MLKSQPTKRSERLLIDSSALHPYGRLQVSILAKLLLYQLWHVVHWIHRVQIFHDISTPQDTQGTLPSKAFPLRISPPEDGRGRGGVAPRSEFHRHPICDLWQVATEGSANLEGSGLEQIQLTHADHPKCHVRTHSYIVLACQKLCQGRGRMCWWKVPQRLSVRMQLKQMHLKMRIMKQPSNGEQSMATMATSAPEAILKHSESVKMCEVCKDHPGTSLSGCQEAAGERYCARVGWEGNGATADCLNVSVSYIRIHIYNYLNDHEDTS